MEPKPGNRRDRKNQAAALAKDIMQHGNYSRYRIDWPMVVAVLGLVVAIFLFVLLRSKSSIAVSLLLAFGCLIYISTHLLTRWKGKSATEIRWIVVLAVLMDAALVSVVGVMGWPPGDPWDISDANKHTLVNKLLDINKRVGHRSTMQFSYLMPDKTGYAYCEKLLLIFTEGEWDASPPFPAGVIVNHPVEGVRLVYKNQNDARVSQLIDAMHSAQIQVEPEYDPLSNAELGIEVGSKPPL